MLSVCITCKPEANNQNVTKSLSNREFLEKRMEISTNHALRHLRLRFVIDSIDTILAAVLR